MASHVVADAYAFNIHVEGFRSDSYLRRANLIYSPAVFRADSFTFQAQLIYLGHSWWTAINYLQHNETFALFEIGLFQSYSKVWPRLYPEGLPLFQEYTFWYKVL